MSGLGEAFVALKNVMLLHERVEDLQKELERQSNAQREMNRTVAAIDSRLARLEGFVEGAAAAAGRAARLPKD